MVSFAEPDVEPILDHLKNAIVGESLAAFQRKRRKRSEGVIKEVVADIEHLATSMPPDFAHGLLIALLSDVVLERLRSAALSAGFPPPVTSRIQ